MYRVSFAEPALFRAVPRMAGIPEMKYRVRVRCRSGDKVLSVAPADSAVIGTFVFEEGADGFVEILAGGSEGQVLADAITFAKVGEAPP
jgi:hypothetical protein